MREQANIGEYSVESSQSEESEKVRLKHLARLNPTKSEVSDLDPETEMSFVALEDFGTDGEIKDSETRALEDVYDGYTYFREGDIAIAKITPSFENGKGAICRDLKNGIGFGTTEIYVLRPREGIPAEFLWYFLRSEGFTQGAKSAMRGVAGQQRIPRDYLENFSSEVAPRQSWNNIAQFINKRVKKMRDLKSRLNRLEPLLARRTASVIGNGISGKFTQEDFRSSAIPGFSEIPVAWKTAKLKYITEDSISYGIVQPGPDVESGVPYIRVSDLEGGELPEGGYMRTTQEIHDQYRRSIIYPGDIIMSIRATVGEVRKIPEHFEEANLGRGIARIRPDSRVHRKYLYYALKSPQVQEELDRLSKGATFDEITLEMVRNLEIPFPPSQEQEVIANRIQERLEVEKRLDAKLTEVKELIEEKRQALITAAVTGQIDVPEDQGENQV